MNAYQFALTARDVLSHTTKEVWAEMFVNLKMEFFRLYQNGKIGTTEYAAEFFNEVIGLIESKTPIIINKEFADEKKNFLFLVLEWRKLLTHQ